MKNKAFALLALALLWAVSGPLSTARAATAPVVVTQPATGMSNSVVRLRGTVNPGGAATTAWFEWGPATAPVALGSGVATLAVSNNLSGLVPGWVYHCRMVASNALGLVRGAYVPFGSPAIALNGGAVLTNECHAAFTDPGATASGAPLVLAAGDGHNLALRNDRTVVGWGGNGAGQATIPAGLSNVVAIAAGYAHSLALLSNGTVRAWGHNASGQTNIPAGLSNVVAIAAGYYHSLALLSDGTVRAWGDNQFGPLNIAGASNVVAIAAGYKLSLALRSDGTVGAWGINDYGQTFLPAGLSNVVAIAAGYYHCLALLSNGTVRRWGDNALENVFLTEGMIDVVAVAAGWDHILALQGDGTVIVRGDNGLGQLNMPAGLSNVVAIAAGNSYNLALQSDGTVIGWGYNGGNTNIPADLNTLNLNISRRGSVDTNAPGSYLLTYTATNGLGGIGSTTRTVVVRDTIAPGITVLGNNPLTNLLNVAFIDPGATALDACGGSVAVSTNNTVNVTAVGSYTVTYTSTDSSGNTTNRTRTVVVAEPTAITQAATSVTGTAATLNGTVNPGGLATGYYFQYGLTTSYGSVTPPNVLPPNWALVFNGNNQFATTSRNVDLANRSFSVEFWARRDGVNRWDMPLTQGTANPRHGLHVGFRISNVFTFAFWGDDLDAPASYSDNAWHHWACTYNQTNNQRVIYRDGLSIVSNTASGPYLENSPLLIARSAQINANFGGALDELRVWDGARTPAQINAYLNTTVAEGTPGLLAYWRFDEGAGASSVDSSGQANTAALIGSPAWIAGIAMPALSAPLTALTPGTLYHFRIVATNSAGTAPGGDMTFTTASAQPVAFNLNGSFLSPGGAFQLRFANLSGLGFTVLGTMNVDLPLSNWTVLGAPSEAPPGQYQFTDSQTTNSPRRFYRVRSP